MKTRTTIEALSSSHKIKYRDTIIALGSCFASEVGGLLKDHDIDCQVNPYGIVYNPASLALQMQQVLAKGPLNSDHFVRRDGLQAHLDYHSKLISIDTDSYQKKLDEINANFLRSVKKAKTVLLTLGTGYAFEYIKTQKIIANCHKVPGQEFRRKLLSIEEITASLDLFIDTMLTMNPDLHFICTVSPIRHIRDTLSGNARSKAHLLVSIHDLIDRNPNCEYFPSYEIMMDDLRDYRYYKDDFIHPTSKALGYIWDTFCDTYMDQVTIAKMKENTRLRKQEGHRPNLDKS